MKIALIGANGQVGSDILTAARGSDIEVVSLTHDRCDVRDRRSLDGAFGALGPHDVVVNTAAYHRVDECETHPEESFAVNACGAFNAAAAAKERRAAIVNFSTDYVFSGSKGEPYVESDHPDPINVYGASKLAGEMLVRIANEKHYIVRVASVFGIAGSSGKGGNFVETIMAKAKSGQQAHVVDDMVMSPSYSADVAGLLLALLERQAPYGTYHLANGGQCSWHEYAAAIYRMSGHSTEVERTSSLARPAPARRPPNSALTSENLARVGLYARPWREGLEDYLKRKGYIDAAKV
ncbi:MAG: dTDP-4-dehydrorhamnose reductase [Candidatus Eremiobacteraeota bacterium]|nr:dTDP-4-dehydrorhamnose reductase [Candidatus Eremiobacteraeota bacterium]MBC5828330.1 dTDP-4-dehydrorhamnose reductase [Candidatus Eremiobacteraeota bacterium]